MNGEVCLLLKARDAPFRTGDTDAYSSSRANLKKGIRIAKYAHKLQIEEHVDNSDPRRMWQGIKALTDYKHPNFTPSTSGNYFYACFDRDNKETATKAGLPPDDQPHTLYHKCSTLSRHLTL
ncbi:hypothetical protein SKAU_G00164090 [Synaphobranchus kaupii]|uniref:Uncharacterized protein n=1 Tax=Synaphobranchus kaupii TaxID=118154 RepID=A0A9Q1FJ35_SYNKA|nr:hypothetical protein SKAU_G00164090 [Synaphobranchus kaupii]